MSLQILDNCINCNYKYYRYLSTLSQNFCNLDCQSSYYYRNKINDIIITNDINKYILNKSIDTIPDSILDNLSDSSLKADSVDVNNIKTKSLPILIKNKKNDKISYTM